MKPVAYFVPSYEKPWVKKKIDAAIAAVMPTIKAAFGDDCSFNVYQGITGRTHLEFNGIEDENHTRALYLIDGFFTLHPML